MNPKFKKTIGIVLITIGFFSLITPFTPFGILFFIGFEMIGGRLVYFDKIKEFLKRRRSLEKKDAD